MRRDSQGLVRYVCIGLSATVLSLLAFLMSDSANADMVKTKDGSVLHGEVQQLSDGNLLLKTVFAGDIAIPWDQVAEVSTETVKPIHLGDGSIVQGVFKTPYGGGIEVISQDGRVSFPVASDQVVAVAPPPPPTPTPVVWEGKVVGSLSGTEGNNDTASISTTLDLLRRAEKDRISLKGGYFYSEDNERTIRDEWFAAAKYDYFLSKRFYTYIHGRMDRARQKDLDLRTSAGAGVGYQFIETPKYNFFGEVGASYVNEDYKKDDDDTSYTAGRAAYHFDWWIKEKVLQFNHDTELLMSFENTKDWFATSTSSLTWRLNTRWALNGMFRVDYDNTPALGRQEDDYYYGLGLAYTF